MNAPDGTSERPFYVVAVRAAAQAPHESNEAGAFAAGFMLGGVVVVAVLLLATWSVSDS